MTLQSIKYIVVHHSATDAFASVEDIRRVHLERGYDDIGYHYLVTHSGEVVTGRPEHIQGAHALGINETSLGVCCIGNFETTPVPEQQLLSLQRLLLGLSERFAIAPDHIITHQEVKQLSLKATPTLCPGHFLQDAVEGIRSWLARAFPSNVTPPLLITLTPEPDGLVRLIGRRILPDSGPPTGAHLPLAGDTVNLSVKAPGEPSPLWSTHANCELKSGVIEFQALIPAWALPIGPARLHVERSPAQTNEITPLLDAALNLPIRHPHQFYRLVFGAHIEVTKAQTIDGFMFRVTGTVRNVGTNSWENLDDEQPYRIGGFIFGLSGGTDSIQHMRQDFLQGRLAPGEVAPFSLTISLLHFPVGRFSLYINIIKDRDLWFTSYEVPGAVVEFECAESQSLAPKQHERFHNPPTSLATTPESASLLYIAPTLPLFDCSGGGFRLLELLKILRKNGVEVTLLCEQWGTSTPDKYLDALQTLGVSVAQNPLDYLSASDQHRFSLCVIGWYECAQRLLVGVQQLLPETRIAVDSVDIHWLREERADKAGAARLSVAEMKLAKDSEHSVYLAADEVWVVSEDDREALIKDLPSTKTRVLGIPCSTHALFTESSPEERVLFIGGFNHPPNESAALWAADIIRKFNNLSGRNVKLDIVGPNAPRSVSDLHDGETVYVHGYVENTDDFFRKAKALLAPLTFGAGVKGKVCEAICKGVPVITTSIGREGLGLTPGESVLVGSSTDEFVERLIELFSGHIDVANLRQKALQQVIANHGVEALTPVLLASCVAPQVVIGIVTYNARDLLTRCLDSLLRITRYPSFKVAVVSNGCTDGSSEILDAYARQYPGKLDIYRNETNEFFVRPNNFLIAQYPSSDFVMMNNDVEVLHEGWLTNLVDAAYSSPSIAAAGGRLLDRDGLISEAGAEIHADGQGLNLCRGLRDNHPSVLEFRLVGYVSGCLMYMRRDAIQLVGPLDDDFHPMYFEDAAWNYRAHELGLKTLYTPWCKAIHLEGSSAGTAVSSSSMKRYQEINRVKFLAKFSDCESYNP